jgi:flagellar export protein FliJ
MKRFKFSLQTLHDIRRRAREEAEAALAAAQAAVVQAEAALTEAVNARRAALDSNAALLGPGEINSHEVALRASYTAVLDRRIAEAQVRLREAEHNRAAKLQAAIAAATAAEATAKLREKHRARHDAEVTRTEQELLDELAAIASARRLTEKV